MFGLVEILLQSLEQLGSQVGKTPVELAQLDQTVFDILGLLRSESAAQCSSKLWNLLNGRSLERRNLDVVSGLVRHCAVLCDGASPFEACC